MQATWRPITWVVVACLAHANLPAADPRPIIEVDLVLRGQFSPRRSATALATKGAIQEKSYGVLQRSTKTHKSARGPYRSRQPKPTPFSFLTCAERASNPDVGSDGQCPARPGQLSQHFAIKGTNGYAFLSVGGGCGCPDVLLKHRNKNARR